MKLLSFHFRKSRYERPSAAKVCGLKAQGGGCELGPDRQGHCPGRAQCVPFRKGDRWECTRSQAAGGRCENGPAPDGRCPHRVHCVPVDSVRSVRRKVTGIAALVVLASILALIYSPLGKTFISPGELSAKHGGVALNQCGDCHGESVDHAQQWFARALAGISGGHSSNKNCLTCHKLGATANLPHSMPSHELAALASANIDDYRALRAATPIPGGREAGAGEIPCFTCHVEHRGRDATLTEVSNQQCDSCHLRQHTPFAEHPEFKAFSPADKTRIAFDHQKHFADYFQKDAVTAMAKTRCDACHELAPGGRQMSVAGFDTACQSCHQRDVTGEKLMPPAIPVLALPMLDIDTFRAERVDIGAWPSFAESMMTPFMFHWLSQYPEIRPLLRKILNGDVDLSYLKDADSQDIRLAGTLVWRIKQLFSNLADDGAGSLIAASEELARSELSRARRSAMFAGLSPALIGDIKRRWFDDLDDEIEAYDSGNYPRSRRFDSPPAPSAPGGARMGGWYADNFTLYYQPVGHADPFMRAWLSFARQHRGDRQSALGDVFAALSERGTPGQCGKCHQGLFADSDDIAWNMTQAGAAGDTLTRFNHAKHFHNLAGEGCVSCHRLDMTQTVEHFSPITKADCQSCHSADAAGEDCTVCHDYHRNKSRVELPATLTRQFSPAQ